jgi:hypothetical protein
MRGVTARREETGEDLASVFKSFAGLAALAFMFVVSAAYIYMDGRFTG